MHHSGVGTEPLYTTLTSFALEEKSMILIIVGKLARNIAVPTSHRVYFNHHIERLGGFRGCLQIAETVGSRTLIREQLSRSLPRIQNGRVRSLLKSSRSRKERQCTAAFSLTGQPLAQRDFAWFGTF
jgi:hypothetical protein